MNTKDTVFRDVTIRTLRRNLSAFRKQQISDAPTSLMITSSINGPHTKNIVAYTLEPKVSADHLRREPPLVFSNLREILQYKKKSSQYKPKQWMGGLHSRPAWGSEQKDTWPKHQQKTICQRSTHILPRLLGYVVSFIVNLLQICIRSLSHGVQTLANTDIANEHLFVVYLINHTSQLNR